jgi:hypothetical protein
MVRRRVQIARTGRRSSFALVCMMLFACSTSTPVFAPIDGGGVRPIDVVPVPSVLDETCRTALEGPFADMPPPADVVVEEDDFTVRVRWDGSLARVPTDFSSAIEGYRICWGPSETDLRHALLVTARHAQIFGVPNGAPQVAVVQAVDQRGRISAPSTIVRFTGDPARVQRLASEMTGFFDDFNVAGPLDELRWNVAYSRCGDAATSHVYVADQHAISVSGNESRLASSVRGTCDHTQNVARPRAVFDFTGREGRIVFDLDGLDGRRTEWALDVLPYATDADIADVTAQIDLGSSHGHPGRLLRFSQAANTFEIRQYDTAGNAVRQVRGETFFSHPESRMLPGAVMRRFEVRVAREHASIAIDGAPVLELPIDLDFERAIVHFAHRGFDPAKAGRQWSMMHWDNFGFDGPPPDAVVHNYKVAFNHRDLVTATAPDAGRFTLTIPDAIEGAASARFFYTMQSSVELYRRNAADRFVVNGNSLPMPEPVSPTGTWEDGTIVQRASAFSTSLELPLDWLRTGVNSFELEAENAHVIDEHVELRFAHGAAPPFTRPQDYIATSPLPSLEPIGPSSYINGLDDTLAWDLDGVGDITITTVADVSTLSFDTPLSGIVRVYAVVVCDRPRRAFGRIAGIARVELVVDGTVVAWVDTAERVATPAIDDGPLETGHPHPGGIALPLDTTALANGPHTMMIRTYDAAGTLGRPEYGFERSGIDGLEAGIEVPVEFTVAN